jgi:hypothetical protein
MDERNQHAAEAVKRLLSERVRRSLPAIANTNGADWRFGSKLVEQKQVASLAPFDALQLKWRLVESDVPGAHKSDLWSYSGHAYWAGRKIIYVGRYRRHIASGAFLYFALELVVGNTH